ncbi:membrane-bound PQQ-dependent dehydrogenase, glucose/quinate/shikimate family [Citrobacter sp. JGM124]|uniref:membrane-bound PQQ-dependent dehydrogenase, glucose/quinate/shikimate family n=1 Tax=Citrobacter sp. JGM124 TaxID=2799789 RepID=UPI001BAC346A|nr:membrane-bound PQQ-dependent dehydrogenase, glucose/quinate/shikimate family [Citrobacter sp. JGM124]MBS0846773.1 membrane-bound PQQ-dependent dehydrogenase, glucose/quinate/shikimate family [Citrobacter sp. JGM124]
MKHDTISKQKGMRAWCILLGLIILLVSLYYIIGGIKLLSLGGSSYFAGTGILMLLSAIQLFRRKSSAVSLFAVAFIVTVIWSLYDAGMEFWPLVARLMVPAGLMLILLLTLPALRLRQGKTALRTPAYASSAVIVIGMVVTFWQMFVPHPTVDEGKPLAIEPIKPGTEHTEWSNYGNTPGGNRFVAQTQINRDNVKDLKVAWTYHTGDTPISPGGNGAEDQQTPLQIGNTLYFCTPHNNVIAVEADTGKTIWKQEINAESQVWNRCRGLAWFDATKPVEQPTKPGSTPVDQVTLQPGDTCQRRILMNTIDARLIALNADTGEFCHFFGDNGQVDLKAGLGDAPDPQYQLTSAPTVAGTTVVVGGRVADNVQTDMPGGVLRGFDVVSGKMRWAFDPGRNDPTLNTLESGQTYVRSTPNSWAPMSYDPEMNTVFIPMGSSSVDLWGADRTKLDHKYGASVLALDATTGKEKWVYQTVHNDLWDFDLPMQPSLVDFPMDDGSTRPAVVIGGKTGMIWVLDRETGKPLTKVEEKPIKKGSIPGEQYTATQPFSVGMPQIGNQTMTESDMWGATPFDLLACRIGFKSMRYDGLFTVPDTDVSLSFPGSLGGMNWGGISFDPTHQYMFVNDMRLGLWVQMVPSDNENTAASNGGESVNTGMGAVPLKGTPYSVNKNRFMSPLGIPCQKPPFGSLSAIDMKTKKVVWQVPVGTVQDTGPFGIKMKAQMPVGMPTLGGTLATQGGLVFIAGTQDYYLRAYDSATGKEVWKARLPVGSQGGPISYISPKNGKQYILISAGGARQSPDRGDYVIAYALD